MFVASSWRLMTETASRLTILSGGKRCKANLLTSRSSSWWWLKYQKAENICQWNESNHIHFFVNSDQTMNVVFRHSLKYSHQALILCTGVHAVKVLENRTKVAEASVLDSWLSYTAVGPHTRSSWGQIIFWAWGDMCEPNETVIITLAGSFKAVFSGISK